MANVRWGIIGTANIARAAFLPGLRAAGGVAAAVAGRDEARTAQWASDHGVERAVTGYQNLIDDDVIDALYIALPNSLHAEWTIAALRAGKPVLCEKPLSGTLADTQRVLAAAHETGTLLWEAFVFPFNEHMDRVRALVADGAIGEVREIQSDFHFNVGRPEQNIRLSADLQGGALLDVGCYPVRLAQEFFGEHESAWAARVVGGRPGVDGTAGVDVETWGSLGYSGDRRLLLSCGMRRSRDTFSRLLGPAARSRSATCSTRVQGTTCGCWLPMASRPCFRRRPTSRRSRRRSGTSARPSPARKPRGCSPPRPLSPRPAPSTTWPRPDRLRCEAADGQDSPAGSVRSHSHPGERASRSVGLLEAGAGGVNLG